VVLQLGVMSAGCIARLLQKWKRSVDSREGHVLETLIGSVDVNKAAEQYGRDICLFPLCTVAHSCCGV
jgi:hypothetical protein